jgi:hypothetical protein
MSERVVLEDQAILLYRRIANEIFRKDLGTDFKEALVKAIGLDDFLLKETGASFSAGVDEIISESINASLHTLFHWAAAYKPSEVNETSQTLEIAMNYITEVTKHLCPSIEEDQ